MMVEYAAEIGEIAEYLSFTVTSVSVTEKVDLMILFNTNLILNMTVCD